MRILKKKYETFRLRLIAALKSGRYKKGKYGLTSIAKDGSETDCCLGVACKLLVEDGQLKRTVNLAVSRVLYDGSQSILPEKATRLIGFNTDTGYPTGLGHSLVHLNDSSSTWDRVIAALEDEETIRKLYRPECLLKSKSGSKIVEPLSH